MSSSLVRSSLDERARDVLEGNTRTVLHHGRSYRFTLPSVDAYPFQWFWDSCFHAIVWSRLDWRRAADELEGLLAWQREDGFIPHVVFWDQAKVSAFSWHYLESHGPGTGIPFSRKPRTTAGIQPPVLAQAVARIVDAGGGDEYLARILPAVERYYRYLAGARDPDGDGLISIISQFEGGFDHSPAYDESVGISRVHPLALLVRTRLPQVRNKLAGFDLDRIFSQGRHQEDVLVNAVYGQGLRTLEALAGRASRGDLARWAGERASAVAAALVERSWDARRRLFFNLTGNEERRTGVKTAQALTPLVLDDLPGEIAAELVERLTDPGEFWSPYPVPSVALDEPAFTPNNRVWGLRFITRGPTTMNLNWFLAHGLRSHGYGDVASQLADCARSLVEQGGFNEFYDPLTGAPVGAPRFGWATLAADI